MKRTAEEVAEQEGGYDPYLGLSVADSWWELGRHINRLRAAESKAEQLEIAGKWADELNAEDDPNVDYSVKATELVEFADNITDLLERKFNGEPIAADVNRLMAPMHGLRYEDDEQFLVRRESGEVFWAIEYAYLFEDLRRRDFSAWSKAVGYCENETCGKFFIRQRIDNRYDSDKCRTNAANRKYYKRRPRPHGGAK